jgi:hypothetical protein
MAEIGIMRLPFSHAKTGAFLIVIGAGICCLKRVHSLHAHGVKTISLEGRRVGDLGRGASGLRNHAPRSYAQLRGNDDNFRF